MRTLYVKAEIIRNKNCYLFPRNLRMNRPPVELGDLAVVSFPGGQRHFKRLFHYFSLSMV